MIREALSWLRGWSLGLVGDGVLGFGLAVGGAESATICGRAGRRRTDRPLQRCGSRRRLRTVAPLTVGENRAARAQQAVEVADTRHTRMLRGGRRADQLVVPRSAGRDRRTARSCRRLLLRREAGRGQSAAPWRRERSAPDRGFELTRTGSCRTPAGRRGSIAPLCTRSSTSHRPVSSTRHPGRTSGRRRPGSPASSRISGTGRELTAVVAGSDRPWPRRSRACRD